MKRKGLDAVVKGAVAGAKMLVALPALASAPAEFPPEKPRQAYEEPVHAKEKIPAVKELETAASVWRGSVDKAKSDVGKMLGESKKFSKDAPAKHALDAFEATFSKSQWNKLPELISTLKSLSSELQESFEEIEEGAGLVERAAFEQKIKTLTAKLRDLFGMDKYNMKTPNSMIIDAFTRWLLENSAQEEETQREPQSHDGSPRIG